MQNKWRKAPKRGVSPIIATILLVAITVVLAAVLYILISGLTHGPGNQPLGSQFAWGTPKNNSSGSPYSYSLTVASANGLSLNNLKFEIVGPSGSLIPTGAYSISMLGFSGNTIGVFSFATNTWTLGGSVSLASSDTVWLHAGTVGLLGDSLVAVGTGSVSGQVTSSAFN